MSIDSIIDATIGKEGGYVNNPNDAGGETKWGITVAVARQYNYFGRMVDLPRETAVRIYKEAYFIEPGFDKILTLSPSIADEMFDTGVNCGVSVPAKFLQRSLNVLNRSHSAKPMFDDLTVDGKLGPKTYAALAALLALRGAQGEVVLLRMLNALQGAYYIEITERREKNEDFTFGWFLHRVVI